MSISGGAAITAALLQLGVYDPGETPSTSEQTNCLLILNEMVANWYNEQLQALTVLLVEQNKAGTAFIASQTKAGSVLVAAQGASGTEYVAEEVRVASAINSSFPLAGGSYTAPSYAAPSYTPATFTPGSISGGSVPNFPDLTTPQTFPTGYELAIVLNLAVKLGPQYPGVGQVTPELLKSAADALAAAAPGAGRLPIVGAGLAGTVQAPPVPPVAPPAPPAAGQPTPPAQP